MVLVVIGRFQELPVGLREVSLAPFSQVRVVQVMRVPLLGPKYYLNQPEPTIL